jgi:hypothetical protein
MAGDKGLNYLNPQTLNRYVYAFDNPERYNDHDGRMFENGDWGSTFWSDMMFNQYSNACPYGDPDYPYDYPRYGGHLQMQDLFGPSKSPLGNRKQQENQSTKEYLF